MTLDRSGHDGPRNSSLRHARWPTAVLVVAALAVGAARAEPLDLTDPTPRAIQVEFEVSVDPTAVGQVYSAPFDATYSATGNTGTVVIPAAEYAAAIQTHELDYFDALATWSLVTGSVPDFTLEIDLTTLEATAPAFVYEVVVTSPVPFPQDGTVARVLSTTAIAGLAFLPQFPGFPFFCSTCFLVPGASYDPSSGRIHAVGSDELVAPDIPGLKGFARAGDLRLSESPAHVPSLPAGAIPVVALVLAGAAFLALRGQGRGALPS
jgi:hypothetical protein